jgi:hypothetical protein
MTQPLPHGGGWGGSSWGGWGWGSPTTSAGAVALVQAYAPAENIVRLTFNQQIYFSGIFDQYDAGDPTHYGISGVTGTVGNDGYTVQPVLVVTAVVSPVPNSIDVLTDRPMSPFPAQYTITMTNLATQGLAGILLSQTAQFFGCYRALQPQSEDVALPIRDLANPSTASMIQGSGLGSALGPAAVASLGVFPIDGRGDYAFDAGIQSLKKRILRRGITSKGAFAHLPRSYGVGLLDRVKSLSTPFVRDRLAAEYQSQIKQEPEVVGASVVALQDLSAPAIVHFVITVQTRTGTTLSLDHPLNTISGISLANFGS